MELISKRFAICYLLLRRKYFRPNYDFMAAMRSSRQLAILLSDIFGFSPMSLPIISPSVNI